MLNYQRVVRLSQIYWPLKRLGIPIAMWNYQSVTGSVFELRLSLWRFHDFMWDWLDESKFRWQPLDISPGVSQKPLIHFWATSGRRASAQLVWKGQRLDVISVRCGLQMAARRLRCHFEPFLHFIMALHLPTSFHDKCVAYARCAWSTRVPCAFRRKFLPLPPAWIKQAACSLRSNGYGAPFSPRFWDKAIKNIVPVMSHYISTWIFPSKPSYIYIYTHTYTYIHIYTYCITPYGWLQFPCYILNTHPLQAGFIDNSIRPTLEKLSGQKMAPGTKLSCPGCRGWAHEKQTRLKYSYWNSDDDDDDDDDDEWLGKECICIWIYNNIYIYMQNVTVVFCPYSRESPRLRSW